MKQPAVFGCNESLQVDTDEKASSPSQLSEQSKADSTFGLKGDPDCVPPYNRHLDYIKLMNEEN